MGPPFAPHGPGLVGCAASGPAVLPRRLRKSATSSRSAAT